MKWLLLVCLLGEISIDGTDFVSDDGESCLSLRATQSASSGTAWYVQNVQATELQAFTGSYELDDSGAVPGVKLQFAHQRYRSLNGRHGGEWKLDYSYHVLDGVRYGVR